jgi:DNA-binding IclR family transcriptional regulator
MRALERLIAILEAVADHSSDTTTTSISTRVGLSLSTTARLVRELEQEGLIERTYENGPYTLGRRFLALARSAIQPASLINAALPVMEELRDLTHETVSLHVRQRALRVCIAQVESRRQVRRVVPVGFEVGINVGATGEVLLAGFPAPDLASYVDSLGLATPDRAALEVRLEQIRRDKWALTVDQVEDGLSGIAAAVIAGGQTIAALSISGPSARWTVSVMRGSVPDILDGARRISLRLAGDSSRSEHPIAGES